MIPRLTTQRRLAGEEREELYARLGLTREAGDEDVERAHHELVTFLEGAPQGLRRWARSEIGAVDDARARLSGPASGAAIPSGPRPRRIAVWVATLAVAVGVVIAVYNLGGGQGEPASRQTEAAGQQGLNPGDQARAARLMRKLDANPKDAASLVALGDLYFKAGDYGTAGGWMEQAVAIEPRNAMARLALGAAMFNLGDAAGARRQWLRVIAIDPDNVEAYYDLGFLYMSKDPPEMVKAKRMWRKVVALAPDSAAAKTVATHLDGVKESGSPPATPPPGEE